MALSMKEKSSLRHDNAAWPDEMKAEFERESRNPNG